MAHGSKVNITNIETMEGEPSCSRSDVDIKLKQYDSDDDKKEEIENISDETSQNKTTKESVVPFYIPGMPKGEPSCSQSDVDIKLKQNDSDDDKKEEIENISDETSQNKTTKESVVPFYTPGMPKGEPSCSQSDDIKLKQNDSDDDVKEELENKSDETSQYQELKVFHSENKESVDPFYIPDMPEDYKETYEAYIKQVVALASVPIEESITPEHIENFKHFNYRYYEDKYCINALPSEPGYNDILIRVHSNKMFLISLASGNDIIRCGKPITGINFMINNSDRSDIKLGGKRKRGAKVIEPHTILCQVKCEGIPKMFNIRAGIPGRIIEINEHVKADPSLLTTDPKGYGYLAVVAPKGHPSNYEKVMADLKLLTEEEYLKHLFERPPKFPEAS